MIIDMQKNIVEHSNKNGYVALMSTIIIGALLLVITIEAGQSGWYTRFMVLGRESKMQSRNLANYCTDQTLLLVMVNNSFIGGVTTTKEVGSCYVYPVRKNYPSVGSLTIRTQANVRGSITNLVTEYDMNNFHLGNSPLTVPAFVPISVSDVYPVLVRQVEVPVLP